MVARVGSLVFSGIEIIDVEVQVQIVPGIPRFIIVGLADKTIAESKERVVAALASMGMSLPAKKILVNLAPADLVKEGSHFDLAISIAIMVALGILPANEISHYLVLGELSLDGNILPVAGVLPAAIGSNARGKGIICARSNGTEAAWSGNNNILAADNLLELINHFKGIQYLSTPQPNKIPQENYYSDLSDIRGQSVAKRVLEVTAAGGHNLLMFGPPGSGKSMLAARLPSIMPELTTQEMLECSVIASLAGHLSNGALVQRRPFRTPHHTCTPAAMVGGGIGRRVKPGEISLAHNGVLFLDELPEFNPSVIEALRQPLETKEVTISRSGTHVRYPANFQLIAAMNPCKCGHLNNPHKVCSRAPACANTYQARISGPILDRFDLHIEIAAIEENYAYYDSILSPSIEESSKIVAARVLKARQIQAERYGGYGILLNNRLDGQLLIDYAIPIDDGRDMLNQAAQKLQLSMRAYNRVLRVGRTIADLAESKVVRKIHIAEALSYRQMDYS